MLKSFSVNNFRIFDNKTTIDFSSTGNYTFNSEAVKNGIANTVILFGKNASGKSSLAYALFDIVSNLTDNYVTPKGYVNYLNAETNQKFAEFEYHFVFNSKEVTYSYKKASVNEILAESLVLDGQTVISYDKQSKSSELLLNLSGTENLHTDLNLIKLSLLKYIKANAVLPKNSNTELFYNLMEFVNKMLLFWSLEDRSFVGYKQQPSTAIIDSLIQNGHFDGLKKFFKAAGFKDEIIHINLAGHEQLFFKFPNKKLVDFNLACSTGMSSLLLFYYWLCDIQDTNKAPSFICIDEFDAFYHFELSRFIVEELKKSNSQVLLTTHNTSLLANDLLRPDCYYICLKNRIVNTHNATQKELREGHNLEKLYRGGTFGK